MEGEVEVGGSGEKWGRKNVQYVDRKGEGDKGMMGLRGEGVRSDKE
jgi:hypothetical protein